jgi:hypothetical protein
VPWEVTVGLAVAVIAYFAMSLERSVTAESPMISHLVRLSVSAFLFAMVLLVLTVVEWMLPGWWG